MDPHRAIGIFQGEPLHGAVVRGGNIHPAFPQKMAAKPQPLGGIVVARHHKHWDMEVRQGSEEAVQHGDRLRGGDGLVVDIPGDEHSIWPAFPGDI